MGDERPLKLAVIITGFWRTHGICGGGGDGGCGGGVGRESERVAAGAGQARLFMIGSEEVKEEAEAAAAAPTSEDGGEEEDARPSQVLWGKALDGKNLMPGQPGRASEGAER